MPFESFIDASNTVEETIIGFLVGWSSRRTVTAEWLAGRLCLPLSACEAALERLAARGALSRCEVDGVLRYGVPARASGTGSRPRHWLLLRKVALVGFCSVLVWLIVAAPTESILDRTSWTGFATLALAASLDWALRR